MRKPNFDSKGVRRLQSIIDTTFADLEIEESSNYARESRRVLAEMLLKIENEERLLTKITERFLKYAMTHSLILSA